MTGIVTYYTAIDGDDYNPAWQAIGYPGPFSPPPEVPKPIKPTEVNHDSTLECDAVINGWAPVEVWLRANWQPPGKPSWYWRWAAIIMKQTSSTSKEQAFRGSIWAKAR